MAEVEPTRDPAAPIAQMIDVHFERGGQRLLEGLSLRIDAPGTTVIMGPNGAGKSLALRILAGLLSPSAGEVLWRGGAQPGPRSVAIVFQKPVLLRRSVRANLEHALRTLGVARDERARRLDELIAMAQLEALANRPARMLSGGEQQRVAMVRALAAKPELLLLDEPTASLDPRSTAAIEQLVSDASLLGCQAVLVTHDAGQAQRLADEVVFVHHGRATEATPARAFFDAPRSLEARSYLDGRLLL